MDFRYDVASMQDIAAHLRETDCNFIPPLSRRVDIDAYAGKLFRSGLRCEAWSEGKLVGLVAGYLNDQEIGFISSVSVLPGWGRRQIGAKLVAAFVESARTARTKKLHLEVHRDNIAALQLYRAAGFSEVHRCCEVVTMSVEFVSRDEG